MKKLILTALALTVSTTAMAEVMYRTNGAGTTARPVVMTYDATKEAWVMGNQGATFYTLPTSMTEVIDGYKDAVADEASSPAFKEGRGLVD